jgi:hypothetical protein
MLLVAISLHPLTSNQIKQLCSLNILYVDEDNNKISADVLIGLGF